MESAPGHLPYARRLLEGAGQACGMADGAIALAYAGVTVLGLSGALAHRATEKIGRGRLCALAFAAGAVACTVLAITRSALMSVGCIALIRVAFSLLQPVQMELQNRLVTSSNRATALSINALIIDGVAIFTNLAFGRLAHAHLPLAMALGTGLCLAGRVLFSSAKLQIGCR